MNTAHTETWEINASHAIHVTFDSREDAPYSAVCMCGWHTASANGGLRNWNVAGHVADVRDGKVRS